MNKLDKYEIFKKCGFGNGEVMPKLNHGAYKQVVDLCYELGYTAALANMKPFQLDKYTKDLETANARLLERNHELQVDNEASLKEVENYAKRNHELRAANDTFVKRFQEYIKVIEELQEANSSLTIGMESLQKDKAEFDRMKTGTSKSKVVITVEEF